MIRYIFIVLILCSGSHSGTFSNRIYNGKRVDNDIEYKFTVAIKWMRRHFCGGSLISFKHVLTAAHCFSRTTPDELSDYKVLAGIVDNTNTGNQRSIQRLYRHEHYGSPADYSYDIALLNLDVPFETSTQGIQIVEIAPKGFVWPADDQGTIFGWGIMETKKLSRYLMYANITLINRVECLRLLYQMPEQFDDMMECAIDREGKKDACQADSGGPLIHMKTGYLVGIVSWGISCGIPENPGVYTNVAYFHDWIKIHAGIF